VIISFIAAALQALTAVAATFAMALGTAITVAVLATLALGSRELALKLGGANAMWAMWCGTLAPSEARWSSCCSAQSCLQLLLDRLGHFKRALTNELSVWILPTDTVAAQHYFSRSSRSSRSRAHSTKR
jgi:hypothetical protein